MIGSVSDRSYIGQVLPLSECTSAVNTVKDDYTNVVDSRERFLTFASVKP